MRLTWLFIILILIVCGNVHAQFSDTDSYPDAVHHVIYLPPNEVPQDPENFALAVSDLDEGRGIPNLGPNEELASQLEVIDAHSIHFLFLKVSLENFEGGTMNGLEMVLEPPSGPLLWVRQLFYLNPGLPSIARPSEPIRLGGSKLDQNFDGSSFEDGAWIDVSDYNMNSAGVWTLRIRSHESMNAEGQRAGELMNWSLSFVDNTGLMIEPVVLADQDGDGVPDELDQCERDPLQQTDADNDGLCDTNNESVNGDVDPTNAAVWYNRQDRLLIDNILNNTDSLDNWQYDEELDPEHRLLSREEDEEGNRSEALPPSLDTAIMTGRHTWRTEGVVSYNAAVPYNDIVHFQRTIPEGSPLRNTNGYRYLKFWFAADSVNQQDELRINIYREGEETCHYQTEGITELVGLDVSWMYYVFDLASKDLRGIQCVLPNPSNPGSPNAINIEAITIWQRLNGLGADEQEYSITARVNDIRFSDSNTPVPAEGFDTDGDGTNDLEDDMPEDPTDTKNFDGDELGDKADIDDDNDGVIDDRDEFPYDSTEQLDTDGDGIGNNADHPFEFDFDNDGFDNVNEIGEPINLDQFPRDPSAWYDREDLVITPDSADGWSADSFRGHLFLSDKLPSLHSASKTGPTTWETKGSLAPEFKGLKKYFRRDFTGNFLNAEGYRYLKFWFYLDKPGINENRLQVTVQSLSGSCVLQSSEELHPGWQYLVVDLLEGSLDTGQPCFPHPSDLNDFNGIGKIVLEQTLDTIRLERTVEPKQVVARINDIRFSDRANQPSTEVSSRILYTNNVFRLRVPNIAEGVANGCSVTPELPGGLDVRLSRESNVCEIIGIAPSTTQSSTHYTVTTLNTLREESRVVVPIEIVEETPFITEWETTANSESVTLLLNEEYQELYDYTVDWGDGTPPTNYVREAAQHTYASAGTYTVKITGAFPQTYFDRNIGFQLKAVKQWGKHQWLSMKQAFYYRRDVVIDVQNNEAPDLSLVTDMSFMFYNADKVNQQVDHWDVSTVTNMQGLFGDTEEFNQPLSDWDVSNVVDMSSMFYRASAFNQALDWDVSSVTDMSQMFSGSKSFNQNLLWGDAVSNAVNLSSMFAFAEKFNGDISNWNVSGVRDMSQMFREARVFNGKIGVWDVSSVEDMSSMFLSASIFNQPLQGWDVSKVTTMSRMFAYALNFDRSLSPWDTSSVTDMLRMFSNATSFNSGLAWGQSVSKVTNMSRMFDNARTFNQPINNWNTSSVTSMSYMFNGASIFNQSLSGWNTSNVRDMSGMFAGAGNFNQPLNSWDTSSVFYMSNMFNGAGNFNQPLNSWDTSRVIIMINMFSGASKFNQLVGAWDVSNVSNMVNIFRGANIGTNTYNNLLRNWSKLRVRSGVVLDMGDIKYFDKVNSDDDFDEGTPVYDGRAELMRQGWTIIDGGEKELDEDDE